MALKKDIRGLSLKNLSVLAVVLAALIVLLGATALGLYLGGLR